MFLAGDLVIAAGAWIFQEGEEDAGYADKRVVFEIKELPLGRSLEAKPMHGAP